MSDKNHEILPLSVVVGYDITKPKAVESTPPAPPETGVFGLSGGRIRFTPSPYAAGVDWDRIEHAPAPACLGAVKMPIAHLSIQVRWFHKLVGAYHDRAKRYAFTKARLKARATKVKHEPSEEEKKVERARHASYMRAYRRRRRMDLDRIKGRTLSPEELKALAEHKRRRALLKKAKDKKRRREIRRAYIDALMRDAERARAEIKGK